MNRRLFAQGLLALTLAALGRSVLAASGKTPRIALVLKSMRNEFFQQMEAGARGHHRARAANYELFVEGVQEETDVKGQEAIIRRLLAQRLDALLLVPADSAAMLPMVLKAMEEGALVINVDNKLDDRALAQAAVNVPFVGPSNYSGARSVGDYVAKLLPAGSKVGLVEGPPTSINAKARSDGFREALRQAGMEVAGIRSGYWEVERGKLAAEALLKLVPELRALLCGNDNMAIGASQAVEAAGRRGQVLIGGYDHIPAIRPLIADGRVAATADQYPGKQAEYGLDLALRALKAGMKQAELPSIVQTPVQLITRRP